jgi:translation elongation factor EF-1alpha
MLTKSVSDPKHTQDRTIAVFGCAGAGKATIMGSMIYKVGMSSYTLGEINVSPLLML